jgi:uncharacterized protein YbaR (Trm112 family)
MSDDYIKLIPTDPSYVPPKPLQKEAIRLLEQMLPEGEECEAEVYERLTFIGQGENLSIIVCPSCHKNLQFTDDETIQEWWHSVDGEEQDQGVEGLMTTMPCCQKRVLFTDLTFDWPAGFAKFELSAMNPNISHDLPPEQVAQREAVLKCKLKQIRAHY